MCHSVEMYLPKMTRDAVEYRLGQADFATAERERAAVDAGLGFWSRLSGWLARAFSKRREV